MNPPRPASPVACVVGDRENDTMHKQLRRIPFSYLRETLSMEDQLLDAVREGRDSEVTQLLIDGASVNCRDVRNYTPLHWSTVKARTNTTELLQLQGHW
eukprot:m.160841 g.160841  ORF g.160841 m.160841 type:complete len:99 (+) comp10279_c0_seq2:100-396(+)